MKTVKVSRPIAKDQTVGSQLGGATATRPDVRTPGWGSLLPGSLAGRIAEGSKSPGCRARLNVQSGHCKLKPNALVSEQCSL